MARRGISNFNMIDEDLERILAERSFDSDYAKVNAFLSHLAICHTIVTSADPKDETKFILNSSSPDELSLINGAKNYGFQFLERNIYNEIIVKNAQTNSNETYKLLNVIEFTSDRKRMTVIVRDPKGKIQVMCKGADSILIPLLANNAMNNQVKNITLQHLYQYATTGLRTLMICQKTIDDQYYRTWAKKYDQAKSSINNQEQKVKSVIAEIEFDFEVLGATAIEDKL